jgi:hypothetical protein
MKTFKQILEETKEKQLSLDSEYEEAKIPKDPRKINLDHLGMLTPEEQRYRDERMDLYMDRHGLNGNAAENKVALEILSNRKGNNK